ncbi:MAG: YsnF/AvaK domain-containing protein [Bdellovibrionales bacterium]|nr:YsnF/AvaK domain-containing protein [Massilia sp.]
MQNSQLQGTQQRSGETQAIPIIQEELKVGKREVQRGGVRIFQRVVETPVNETVGLREERVNVERHAVDRPISAADVNAFQETTIELRETAEEAVVSKTARVVEEVVIGKDVSQRQEQITDTVRRTEVDVQQISPQDETYFRNHYTGNYANAGGTYEEYAPAYSYGSTMRGSDTYRNRQWDDAEPSLRSDWESRNPGSTWEKMKAAVRHGWDKVTS